jgi:hypothetical protein
MWFVPVPGPDSIRFRWIEGGNITPPASIAYPQRVSYAPDSVHTNQRTPYLTDVYQASRYLGYIGVNGRLDGPNDSTSWAAWRRYKPDSTWVDRVNYGSRAEAVAALTRPYTGPPWIAPVMPELPRVYLDTRMPPTP